MKKALVIAGIVALLLIGLAVVYFAADPKQEIVREAYIYGYPLVTMDMARGRRPMNSAR